MPKFDTSWGFVPSTARDVEAMWHADPAVKKDICTQIEELFGKVRDLPGNLIIRVSMEVPDPSERFDPSGDKVLDANGDKVTIQIV